MSTKSKRTGPIPFVLDTETTFKWPVTVLVPSATNVGQKVKMKFEAEFVHVSQERRLELMTEHREAMKEIATSSPEEQMEGLFSIAQRVLDEVFVGATGILNRDRQPVEFSDETKKALIQHQMVYPAIFEAYNSAIRQQEPRGN